MVVKVEVTGRASVADSFGIDSYGRRSNNKSAKLELWWTSLHGEQTLYGHVHSDEYRIDRVRSLIKQWRVKQLILAANGRTKSYPKRNCRSKPTE